ncbi:Transcription factor E2F/dimerization partner (TDP) [Cynara cardunculus var. scolymus]|uniref:Transcription factor E2F/dimerization partner (TDP) n=1 Tax=Cynara cardunculus var. scolymus TaxID=59895 RepID=A0A103R5F1_CYNCS|nr:Transcription factor E2F/dimerization partner (TDP) [Cynara cardunculus var. scolymus]
MNEKRRILRTDSHSLDNMSSLNEGSPNIMWMESSLTLQVFFVEEQIALHLSSFKFIFVSTTFCKSIGALFLNPAEFEKDFHPWRHCMIPKLKILLFTVEKRNLSAFYAPSVERRRIYDIVNILESVGARVRVPDAIWVDWTMMRYGQIAIIILRNNGGYSIEEEIHERHLEHNDFSTPSPRLENYRDQPYRLMNEVSLQQRSHRVIDPVPSPGTDSPHNRHLLETVRGS